MLNGILIWVIIQTRQFLESNGLSEVNVTQVTYIVIGNIYVNLRKMSPICLMMVQSRAHQTYASMGLRQARQMLTWLCSGGPLDNCFYNSSYKTSWCTPVGPVMPNVGLSGIFIINIADIHNMQSKWSHVSEKESKMTPVLVSWKQYLTVYLLAVCGQ